MPAPKGKNAAKPKPRPEPGSKKEDTAPDLEITSEGGTPMCNCPPNDCRVNAIDPDKFNCREGNDPETMGEDDLIEKVARLFCSERELAPDQFINGKRNWEWMIPEARIMVRGLHIILEHLSGEGA